MRWGIWIFHRYLKLMNISDIMAMVLVYYTYINKLEISFERKGYILWFEIPINWNFCI